MAYYDKALVHQDYYSKDDTIQGRWGGQLAKEMGLGEFVQKEEFERFTKNRHPVTGDKLTPKDYKNRRIGYDHTFNAVKSASLVYAITGDKAILEAHQLAVKEAMQELEKNVQTQAGRGKNKHYATTGNMVYGSFTHFTARPVNRRKEDGSTILSSDMHLHSHAIVMNCTWNEKMKRYQAVELSSTKRDAPYYEAYYHSRMAHYLQKAGYKIEQSGRFYEIAGIDRKTIMKFSGRTKQILEVIEKNNITDRKVKDKLGAWTRMKKIEDIPDADLRTEWLSRLTPEEMEIIFSAKGKAKQDDQKSKEGFVTDIDEAIDKALDHHLERKSAVPEKHVIAYAIKKGFGKYTPDQVIEHLKNRKDVIGVQRGKTRIVTTKAMVRAEEQNIEFALKGRNTLKPLNPKYAIKDPILNKDQREAVKHVLKSKDRVTMIAGDAGVGKTTLLKSVKDGIEKSGKTLFSFALSADASRGAMRDKGFENATTIKALLESKKLQVQTRNQVILVDEAAMVGTKTMQQIFQISKAQNARIILSGDYKQHAAVQSGDVMRYLEQKAKLPVKRVKEIVRQKNNPQLKKAVQHLANGKQAQAFKILDKNKAIHEIQDHAARDQEIAAAYLKCLKEKKSVMVVSPTHYEGQRVSEKIRCLLKEKGIIDKKEKLYQTQKALSFTEVEKRDHTMYEPGMVVQFHKRTKGFRHGHGYEVKDIKGEQVLIQKDKSGKLTPLPFNLNKNFQVYERTETLVAKGDMLRITVNGKTLEGKRVNNGQVLKVEGYDQAGNIQLEGKRTLSKSYSNFTLGYYRTSHASQGKDAHTLLLSQSSETFAASNEKQAYVSISRGAKDVQVFTDDKEALLSAMSKKADRLDALDIANEHWKKEIKRKSKDNMKERLYEQSKSKSYELEQKRKVRAPQKQIQDRGREITK